MRFLILLFTIAYLNQIINARKSEDNIVLSGGGKSGGCCNSGGALVMQNGKKGKKNEKLIIKDDALIMQNGNADGNLIMDGNNLIFQEGKKNENIIIKGSGGGCCNSEDIHHKEEHIRPHPIAIPIHFNTAHTQEHRTYVPVPVHFKKKIVHHHHTKEVHHHNDELGLGESRRKDSITDNDKEEIEEEEEETSPSEKREERDTSSKRKSKNKKFKIRKLNLGDKLTSKEKENLKLKRIDKRLGLGRFKLAGRMMKKIRFKRKKKSKKTSTQSKEEDNKDQESNSKENNSQQENTNSDQQQYEEEEEEDGKDQDDEASNSNLYEGLTNALYQNAAGPILNPMPAFNNMMDIYPAAPQSLLVPSTLATDRHDLNKKKIYENLENEREKNLKKLINEEVIKNNQNQIIKEDQEKIKANNNDVKEEMESEEFDNNDDQNLKLNNKSKSLKINNLINNESKTINQTNKNVLQPVFTLDERQLTPALISLLALTTNAQQRQSLINRNLNHQQQTLPLFTPEKTNLENSAALLLPLIARQSQHQQHLIRIQHQKLLEQEAKQKELTKQLQQVTEHNKQKELKKNLFKEEIVGKSYIIKEPDEFDKFEEKENSRLQYENDLDYFDEKFKYDYIGRDKLKRLDRETINRLRRRKSDELNNQLEINQSKDTLNSLIKKQEQLLRLQQNNKKEDDEFDAFSDFDADRRLFTNTKLRTRKQNEPSLFSKRMLEPEYVTTNNKNRNDNHNNTVTSDYKDFQINEVKLAKNASLIVYGY